jgi:hypothetical protein
MAEDSAPEWPKPEGSAIAVELIDGNLIIEAVKCMMIVDPKRAISLNEW